MTCTNSQMHCRDAQRHQASILTVFGLARRGMRASSPGLGGQTLTALQSPKGCDSCDSTEPKTFANLDYIRPIVCQHWSEYIQAAATLHQQSPGAALQPKLTGNRPIIRSVTGTGPTQKDGNLQMRNADGWRDHLRETNTAMVFRNATVYIGGNCLVL